MTGSRIRALRRGAVALVLVAGSFPAAYATTEYVRHHLHDHDTLAGTAIPAALAGVAKPPARTRTAAAPLPTASGIARALTQALADQSLGPRVRVDVEDVTSGRDLYQRGATAPAVPASTAKLFTAAAALAVLKPTDRIETVVVRGTIPGTVVVIGGGDPTLTAATGSTGPDYPGAARLADLAAQLRKRNVPVNRIVVDDSLYSGPDVSPAWAKDDVPSDYASAITPFLVDGGRANPGDVVRSDIPDVAAAQRLADLLDIPNAEIVHGRAPKHATRLAVVRSAPIATLVRQMLQESDNVLAECLARRVALAERQPASFAGSVRAVRAVLHRLGLDIGTGMVDGSGLSVKDRVSAHALAQVLHLATTEARLRPVLADLPVGAWSGTLVQRYRGPIGHYAAGLVRAKTGTLSNVSSLAGLIHDHSGRLLVFVVVADRVPDGLTPYAEAAIDIAVTRIAQCGCS